MYYIASGLVCSMQSLHVRSEVMSASRWMGWEGVFHFSFPQNRTRSICVCKRSGVIMIHKLLKSINCLEKSDMIHQNTDIDVTVNNA
jgi:hypothetical protein